LAAFKPQEDDWCHAMGLLSRGYAFSSPSRPPARIQ